MQSFHDHVKEFRRRLAWVVVSVLISSSVAYVFRNYLVKLLEKPIARPLYYTSPAGSFNFILKLSTVVGIFVALPIGVYQLIRFIEPALPKRITKFTIAKLLSGSYFLALSGIAFGYFIMVPLSLKFFKTFSSNQIKPLIIANDYLSYVMGVLIIFALIFQIPLITLFINHIKPIKPSRLLHYQKWVIAGAFVISLALPFTYDPISQFVVAIPMIGLYYLSVLLVAITNRKSKTKRAHQEVKTVVVEPSPEPAFAAPTPVNPISPYPRLKPLTKSIDGILST